MLADKPARKVRAARKTDRKQDRVLHGSGKTGVRASSSGSLGAALAEAVKAETVGSGRRVRATGKGSAQTGVAGTGRAPDKTAELVRKAQHADKGVTGRQYSYKGKPIKGGYLPIREALKHQGVNQGLGADMNKLAGDDAAGWVVRNALKVGSAPIQAATAIVDKAAGTKANRYLNETIDNVGPSAARFVKNTPQSIAMLGDTVWHKGPWEGFKMVGQPYVELAKHPLQQLHDDPAGTAALVAPLPKFVSSVGGRGLRLAGKQTLAGPVKRIPGSVYKEAERLPRGAYGNWRAVRALNREAPVPTSTAMKMRQGAYQAVSNGPLRRAHGQLRDLTRERTRSGQVWSQHQENVARSQFADRDLSKELSRRQQNAAIDQWQAQLLREKDRRRKGAKRKAREKVIAKYPSRRVRMSKPVRDELRIETAKRLEGVEQSGPKIERRMTALKFGSPNRFTPSGVFDRPFVSADHTPEVAIHPSKAAAERVAERTLENGSRAKVVKVGKGQFAVVPRSVTDRMRAHATVGTSKAPGAIVLRRSRAALSKAILPFSPSFFMGQAVEGPVRGGFFGVIPKVHSRFNKMTLAELEKIDKPAARDMQTRVPMGMFGGHMQHMPHDKGTLADDLAEMPDTMAGKMHKAALGLQMVQELPGVRQARKGINRYQDMAFGFNTGVLEAPFIRGMSGRAMMRSPAMERKVLPSKRNAKATAKWLSEHPEGRAAIAREVENAYGKYSGFSPSTRELQAHWTPFLPWYLNSARFVGRMPIDYPGKTVLIGAAQKATADERAQRGLKDGELPWRVAARLAHWTPFGIVEAANRPAKVAGMVLPQLSPMLNAAYGRTYTGMENRNPDGSRYSDAQNILAGLIGEGSALVPGVSMYDRLTGKLSRNYLGRPDTETGLGKNLKRLTYGIMEPFPESKKKPRKRRKAKRRSSNPLDRVVIGGGSSGVDPMDRVVIGGDSSGVNPMDRIK